MQYWLIVTSPENFRFDREHLNFKLQGLPYRFRKQVKKMQIGDRVAYYIMKIQKFGATATITGEYLMIQQNYGQIKMKCGLQGEHQNLISY